MPQLCSDFLTSGVRLILWGNVGSTNTNFDHVWRVIVENFINSQSASHMRQSCQPLSSTICSVPTSASKKQLRQTMTKLNLHQILNISQRRNPNSSTRLAFALILATTWRWSPFSKHSTSVKTLAFHSRSRTKQCIGTGKWCHCWVLNQAMHCYSCYSSEW